MLKKALFLTLLLTTPLFAATRAYVGVGLITPTPELRQYFGAPADSGLIVSGVEKGSPAAKAGLRAGDVIISVDGKTIGNYKDLVGVMEGHHTGDNVRFEVVRDKHTQVIVATAEEREIREMREMPDADQLRVKIRELERRLQELESRNNK